MQITFLEDHASDLTAGRLYVKGQTARDSSDVRLKMHALIERGIAAPAGETKPAYEEGKAAGKVVAVPAGAALRITASKPGGYYTLSDGRQVRGKAALRALGLDPGDAPPAGGDDA